MPRTVRLAVTGLSRAGKTVFITSLVHNLLSAANGAASMPNLAAARERRLIGAVIRPDVGGLPQFPYERNIAHLGSGDGWPPQTESISRITLGLRFRPRGWLGRRLARGALTVELIDYPGEWLLDLPLKDTDFAAWSTEVLADCTKEPRAPLAAEWLALLCAHGPDAPADEAVARRVHELYRDFLRACRDQAGLRYLQPGRFLRRGDAEDGPPFWFCPLPPAAPGARYREGSLGALMAERFEAYKAKVVVPFFREHFRSFNRQVVLVDVLSALHGGWHVFQDTARALEVVSRAFVYGRGSFFKNWFRPSIDRVLFAATKADHVTLEQRPQLRELLRHLVTKPAGSAGYDGAEAKFQALGSVVCTVDERAVIDGQAVHVVVGNMAGDGRRAQVFPGQIPIEPPERDFFLKRFVGYPSFLPPRFNQAPVGGIPHYGLDEAVQNLIGSDLE